MSSCLRTVRKSAIMSNGAILLEKLIASCNGKCNPIRSFSVKELKMATKNYNMAKVITKGFYYKLYKGFLQDRPISVMKFEGNLEAQQDCFNNIIFASQMSHKNILKLIGCCLETQIPVLVFESVEYGTLADCIYSHLQSHYEALPWAHRLKIAMEIANAVTYLHIGFPRPIVFRGIRPSKILFDEHYVAKLIDFSESESIPEGETHIKNELKRKIEFFTPEQLRTDLNEKCDVVSFGALLLVHLTGQKILDFSYLETSGGCFLQDRMEKYIEDNKFNEIVDPILVGTGLYPEKGKQLQAFAELAFKCLSKSAEDRPTMIQVTKQLRTGVNAITRQLLSSKKKPRDNKSF